MTIVAIFPGPGSYFRVREWSDGVILIVKWASSLEDAQRFVREYYQEQEIVSAVLFREYVKS